jgi:hypothetical protein
MLLLSAHRIITVVVIDRHTEIKVNDRPSCFSIFIFSSAYPSCIPNLGVLLSTLFCGEYYYCCRRMGILNMNIRVFDSTWSLH